MFYCRNITAMKHFVLNPFFYFFMNYEYKDIITYNPMADMNFEYKEINSLIKQNLENHTMPYNFSKPFPVNVNIVNGNSSNVDINFDKFELKARSIGAESTLWIYGADAEYLGLELKSCNPKEYAAAKSKNKNFNCKPLTIQMPKERLVGKKTQNQTNTLNESLCMYNQTAYLLDQFTEESVARLFNEKELRKHLSYSDYQSDRIKKIVSEITKNNYRYNENLNREKIGLDENGKTIYKTETAEERNERYKNMKKNIFLNSKESMNAPGNKEYKSTLRKISEKYMPEQKVIFDYAVKYHTNQSCPKDDVIFRFSPERKELLDKAFSSILNKIEKNPKISGITTRTLFDGFAFSERLTHLDFSLEPIFTKEEELAKNINLSNKPKAMQEEKEQSILDDNAKKRLRQRSFSMHVGQDLGM